jgi:hypothetical protein
MKKSVVVIAALAMAFLATGLQAAQPDFTGEWKLNVAKSEYPPVVPAPEVMTRKIKHADPSLAISTYQKGPSGESTTELKYTTDGKEATNKMQGNDVKGTAKWEGDLLVIDSVREIQGAGELKFHEAWSLTEGGKVYKIATHIVAPQGEFDISLVFDKQ